jgi:hypoxanthine phosphoribosyltransferase
LNILISEDKIRKRVGELAQQINDDYRDRNPILVGVLKGSFIFLADMIRQLSIDLEVDFLSIHSYDGRESSGIVRITHDLSLNCEDRDLLLIEDIIDTGRTVNFIIENIKTHKPRDLAVCALLSKKGTRLIDIPLAYCGFEIPNIFVVGYGLDYANKYRNLPYIGVADG